MSFHKQYNQTFLNDPTETAKETNLIAGGSYGVRIVRAAGVNQGEQHWRVIGIHHLTPEENRGNHHVYLEALDAQGNRVRQPVVEVEWGWEGMQGHENPSPARLDKTDAEPGADIAIDRTSQRVWVQVKGAKSDRVENLHTNHGWEKLPNSDENGSYEGHHSFYVVFQQTTKSGDKQPDPINGETDTDPALLSALQAAGNSHRLPLNPEAALFKFAMAHNLGQRLSLEYPVYFAGQAYVAQLFEKGLVYMPAGQWDQIKLAGAVEAGKEVEKSEVMVDAGAMSFSMAAVTEGVLWHTEMSGFSGNRWQYWEQHLQGKVTGIDFKHFAEEVEVRNPHLPADGHVFKPEKTYVVPGNLGRIDHAASPTPPSPIPPASTGDPALADSFIYPVGKPDAAGYYVAAGFLASAYHQQRGFWHPGEDWNRKLRPGDTPDIDLGDPVYAIANGRVVTAHAFSVWGNIVLLEHKLPNGQTVWSQYAHLDKRLVKKDDVVRKGDPIGTIGKGENNQFPAHLHFEIRLKSLPASKWGWKTEADREAVRQHYADPREFIKARYRA